MKHFKKSIPLTAKRIPDMPGYYADIDGSIYTKSQRGNPQWRNEKTKINVIELSQNTTSNSGYKLFQPYIDGKRTLKYVHHAVAAAFLGARPEDLVIDHIDRDKWNNHKDNLRYCTRSENYQNSERRDKYLSRS